MGLINREAAIDAIVSQSIYETREAIAEAVRNDYKKSDEWLGGIDDAISTIEEMNTVPAVPLEPLCQWLAGYAAPPNYALDEVREDSIDPESLVYTANDRAKAWEFHFRQLLRSGLMDTEESNAEK